MSLSNFQKQPFTAVLEKRDSWNLDKNVEISGEGVILAYLWQKLELASKFKSNLQDTVD